jgi:hypothetical protein
MRGQGQGWLVVLRASKQRVGRKTPWPIVGGPRSGAKHRKLKRPVWICSGPNTALLYPTRQDLGILAVGSLLLFQSIETVSQQKLCTGSCQSRWMTCHDLVAAAPITFTFSPIGHKCLRYRCELRNLRARSKDEDWQQAWNASRRTTYGRTRHRESYVENIASKDSINHHHQDHRLPPNKKIENEKTKHEAQLERRL